MRLPADHIAIAVGGERVRLRPTLRAAVTLDARFGGLHLAIAAVLDGSITALADVVEATSEGRSTIPDVLRSLEEMPLRKGIEAFTDPVLNVLCAFVGRDNETDRKPETGKPVTFAEYHERLFEIATGWLGWAPDTAWCATPSEILAAYRGKLEMLQAIYGSGKEPDDDPRSALDHTDDDIAEGWATLRTMAASGENRGR
jgi:hypothetical protein